MNKRRFFSNIVGAGSGIPLSELRTMIKNHPQEFVHKIQNLADSGKLKLQDFRNLRDLFLYTHDLQVPVQMEVMGAQRAITASAFPILTGTLAIAAINAAYATVPTIGEQLVTEIEDNKKVTTIAAVNALDNKVDEVKETEDFPEIGSDEEKVEIRHKRNGRKLTVSAESIEENELADILSRINALGEIAAEFVEEQTLRRVTDYYGSKSSAAEPYVYRPGGTGTALFSATANTPGTRAPSGTCVQNNALVDETDLDAARVRLASMKNARGTRISLPWSEVVVLVPYALIGTLAKIGNSEYVPGVENEQNNYGPRGMWSIPPERRLTTPKLDDLSATAWYMGMPKRQFRRKWKLRFEYVTLGADTQAYLNSRIAFQARIAWDCEIGATDYVYWVQNLSATTFPADA
ncbi:MAG: hypothetical protein WC372_08805 [Candidatus Neomarinimicrobiota bacterium]|jgi:hypothetical protein